MDTKIKKVWNKHGWLVLPMSLLLGAGAAWASISNAVIDHGERLVAIENEKNPVRFAVIETKINMMMVKMGFSIKDIENAEQNPAH